MLEKVMIPLTLIFGTVLYFTRDAGFDFNAASVEQRAGFTERQSRAWVTRAGLAPVLRSQVKSVETRDGGMIAIVRIHLNDTSLVTRKRTETYARGCTAYMKSRLAEFGIAESVRIESDTGALVANYSFKPGTCSRYAPKAD
jgi:hypothetical protein